ncbi:MAG: hypothetical protein ACI3XT_01365 [Butyricicoccaceae bacterium]
MSSYKLKTGDMAEKAASAYQKIEDTVVDSYKKVEDTVVGGYKKIENTVVDSYKKIEDSFVGAFLEKTEDADRDPQPEEKK